MYHHQSNFKIRGKIPSYTYIYTYTTIQIKNLNTKIYRNKANQYYLNKYMSQISHKYIS